MASSSFNVPRRKYDVFISFRGEDTRRDPSTVRYQKRCYEDAFTRHEKFGHNSFKIERWRTSLKKVANLSGIDSSKFETDAELVEKIVDCVRVKMKNIMLQNDSTELIGSHERIKELELLLCKRLQDVEIIGIWGMGGIGKTTMASLLFKKLSHGYEGYYILENSSLHPTIGLRDLQDKALITISSNGEVSMHDLIQEMARQIVREESPNDPGKRRHLWDQDEIYKVLKNNLGTGVIESISLQSWRGKEIQLDPKAFKKMVNLKIFKFQCRYGLLMSDKIHNSLPKELNYFKWEVYPSNSPPSKVCLKILVENHMRDSTVERLWDESQDLGNSKQIDLFGSRDLEELPDKSMASKHKIFDLSFCFSLHLDHPSTLSNHNLLELILFACQDLQRTHVWLSLLPQLNSLLTVVKKFHLLTTFGLLNSLRVLNFSQSNVVSWPESIKHLRNLEQLCLRCCSRLRSIPELPPSIRILDVSYCISLESLFTSNFSMAHLPNLRYLYLRGCSRLRSIPELPPSIRILDVSYCISLETLFTSNFSMAHFPNLEHLYLRGCSRLRSIPELPPSIKILDVSYCISLETLFTSNFSMVHLPNLRYLCLLGCSRLRSIPELPPSIRILDVSYCISLENLFTSNFSMAHFPNLEYLYLRGCSRLRSIPELPPSIRILDVSYCISLETLFTSNFSMAHFPNLEHLYLRGCSRLRSIPELPPSIRILDASYCASLETLFTSNFSMAHLPNLEHLCLGGCSRLRSIPELPPSIRILDVSYCTSLETLFTSNFSMAHFPNLEHLYLRGCSRLRSIPELPPSIRILDASYCASLETLFTSNFSMAHLPNLEHLCLGGCSRLRSIPELPPSIRILDVSYCTSLETLFTSNFSMAHLPNLEHLYLLGCSSVYTRASIFP
ncbi:hypothetical protein L6164_000116 [Bauhinia variegata]|uniref:Uncharacterized protein n=1 Tax=Bauhinia variegata TaxID=167791 RepID=A0ACB9Q706_BAUVA|nr:hypothetical protein L6164_000116 [Bauhinia variegata]